MITLEELKFMQRRIGSDYDLDLNYSSMPTVDRVMERPRYPFNDADRKQDAWQMLEIWWKLEAIIKDLELHAKIAGLSQIPIQLREYGPVTHENTDQTAPAPEDQRGPKKSSRTPS